MHVVLSSSDDDTTVDADDADLSSNDADVTQSVNNDTAGSSIAQKRQFKHSCLISLTLCKLVESQYTEAVRAMCGMGDFVLRRAFVRHRLTIIDAWRMISAKK